MSDYNNRDYDENAARFAGETVGRAEGTYDRADAAIDRQEQRVGDSFRRDEQAVENAPENLARYAEQGFTSTVNSVENIPSDIGSGLRSAANWIGEQIGGAENEGRRAEQGVENRYDQAEQGVENRYNDAEQDVDRFGQGVQNSYDQGEQQGRRDGW
ncbi:unnamed protein product [Aureobasidium uvarum]|uniref:Uncharacterized protein n=1 Tax=Aureobasidium uvarum TaxID=2773716 RepID=A0A9N8KR74_9PEZI|nr:unnamed protein product [Aureobasidium uvarum]